VRQLKQFTVLKTGKAARHGTETETEPEPKLTCHQQAGREWEWEWNWEWVPKRNTSQSKQMGRIQIIC